MRNGELPQGMYTPIPQNMTDSDSEEELHIRSNIGPFNSHVSSYKNTHKMSFNNGHHHNNSASNNTDQQDSFANIHFTNYYNSDEDKAYSSNPYQPTIEPDNVAILNANMKKRKPMSTARKICFVVSILVCILTVVIFLWVVPCNDNQTCPAKSERVHTNSWLRNYERIELKGAINVVHGLRGRSNNLIFMYRGSNLFPGADQTTIRRSGIISLVGSSGQVGWYDEMNSEPNIIDCSLIDADQNGEPDCLVVDEFGEIGCINPMTGQWVWRNNGKIMQQTRQMSFPLILPDVNQDGVGDLLVVVPNRSGHYNTLKLLSGATGQSIGGGYAVKTCTFVHKFHLDGNFKITFNCINNETEIAIIKPLAEIYSLITNKAIDLHPFNGQPEIPQHRFYGQRKETVNQRNIYSVNGKQLIVENNGKCPDTCNVTVTLLEEKDGKTTVIRNFNGSRMYGMVPARLSFSNSADKSKSNVHGFVIKFWEWGVKSTKVTKTDKTKTAAPKVNTETTANQNEFNKFSNVMRKKRSWNGLPLLNDNPTNKTNLSLIPSRMRLIKETVILMVFNSTDVRIENTSQSNIIQFCTNGKNNSEPTCQPDLNYQENSLLIADLDQDGSQELVSYYSTYIDTEDPKNKWKLMTYVQLLRLEAELPKLYDNDEKN